jgi:hypothetical protein
MAKTAIEALATAIGYPDGIPAGAADFAFRVDGDEVYAYVSGGRVVLCRRLSGDPEVLPALAAFAAGRMLREDAVLAFGELGGSQCAFLWQDAPESSDERTLSRLFETFVDSCDWWKARVEGARDERAEIPPMMIRP